MDWGKLRRPWRSGKFSAKTIIGSLLLGLITLVMALFGVLTPDRSGSVGGGSAAVVNDASISIADYRRRVDMVERNSKFPLDKLPPEQREMYNKEIQRRTLEQMILQEIVYQTAHRQGIWASNSQVRDDLLAIPVFQENGRFVRQRYDGFLAAIGQSSDDFEGQLRKEIVVQKMQDLFQTAAMPSSMEVDHIAALASKTASVRYVELNPAKLASEKSVTDKEVTDFLKDPSHQKEIKDYYEEHALDYNLPERVHARHILLLVDDKHPDKEVAEKAKALRAHLTVKNFASIAEKESQDPGSAKKGGDLGFFERGRMVPQFEKVAFALKPGEISEPTKTEFGYHIIYVEAHDHARTVGLEEAKAGIARKLAAQQKVPASMEAFKKAVESGKTAAVDAELKKLGFSWQKAENVSLAGSNLAGVEDPSEVLTALALSGDKTGLIPHLLGSHDRRYAVDVVAWKANPKPPSRDDLVKNLAYQASSDSFENWIREAESKASISRNPRLIER